MSQPDLSLAGLDAIDQDIIDLLRIDGRMSFTEIAKRLDIPEATARYRVQRLLQSGTIKVLAWPNPERMGTPNLLIVQLSVEPSRIEAIVNELASLEEVRFVAVTAGRYNVIVDIFFGVHAELVAFFAKLQQISGILSYESQLVLKLLKAEYKYTLV
jgi:Lrp/AsnC family transcriptional regulator for asnA, asnC and gidA